MTGDDMWGPCEFSQLLPLLYWAEGDPITVNSKIEPQGCLVTVDACDDDGRPNSMTPDRKQPFEKVKDAI
ncbi:MAG: hypothetical protein ACF8CQ_25150 [Rhodopirellula sp. JB044]|uniref:hypothetical protein n=1 Tax=Rhodopirellula sp. JB044 TaxID=3342844 RepID=UPI00370BE24B